MNGTGEIRSPAEEFLSLAARLLWVLYLVFWLSIGAYVVIVFVGAAYVSSSTTEGLGELVRLPESWGVTEFTLTLLGIACLVGVHLLGSRLINARRLWGGARDLRELVAQQQARRKPAEEGSLVSYAVQQLLGRIVIAHLLIWFLAEVPAVIGLIDRFLGGDHALFLLMILISALALTLQRPSREALAEILAPIMEAFPAAAQAQDAGRRAQAGAGSAPEDRGPNLTLVEPPDED